MKQIQRNQHGFTILELMIATMVFSVILLLVTTGIINIGKTYYKGALQARTQDTARNIIDEISRGIQFSGVDALQTTPLNVVATPYPVAGGKYGLCVNDIRYAYVLDKQLATVNSGDKVTKTLISYNGSCSGTPPLVENVATVTGKELLGLGMRLTALEVKSIGTNTFSVTVEVASGDRDLFDPPFISGNISASCKSGAGKEFCAISRLSTIVQKRVI